jgi:hypothetical protein
MTPTQLLNGPEHEHRSRREQYRGSGEDQELSTDRFQREPAAVGELQRTHRDGTGQQVSEHLRERQSGQQQGRRAEQQQAYPED